METDKDESLNNYKDSTKSKSKPLNTKKIIFISLSFIFDFGFFNNDYFINSSITKNK